MGRHSVTMSHNLSATTAQNLPLGVHNLNSMVVGVPTHVPASWGPFATVGVLAFYVSCMQLTPENPSALGPRRL